MNWTQYGYRWWLERWKNNNIWIATAREVMVNKLYDSDGVNLVLRHDIDSINGKNIEIMAKIEEDQNVRASYYIIPDKKYRYYKKYKNLFLELQHRGHEIGLHVNAIELSHKPWRAREKQDALQRLDGDINRLRDDGFNINTMCAHGFPLRPTNKDIIAEYKKDLPVGFSDYFSLYQCVLTDSRVRNPRNFKGIQQDTGLVNISQRNNIFSGEIESGVYYTVIHPESYHFDGVFKTLGHNVRYIEDIEHDELNRLA